MARQNVIQESWTKGEISPLAQGRVGVNLYTTGAKKVENLICLPQGGLFRRSGTKWVHNSKNPSEECNIVPFEVSDEQAYMLEFGKGYIRFFKNKEPVFETTTDEVEAFTLADNGGLMQLSAASIVWDGTELGDLPTFAISRVSPVRPTGTDSYWIVTTRPHTYRAGAKVWIDGTGIGSLDGLQHTVTDATTLMFKIRNRPLVKRLNAFCHHEPLGHLRVISRS